MKAIIMAQGEGSRWRIFDRPSRRVLILPNEKHLINIGKFGVPNVIRTIRMLQDHGCSDYVLVARPHTSICADENTWTLDEPTGPLLRGIALTAPAWDDKTIILLGDVIFSHAMMDAMISNPGLHVYGRVGTNRFTGKEASELFAITFHEEHQIEILDHCLWMISRGRPIRYPPKLWALYRLLAGFDHADEARHEDEILIQMDDYTDDIDSVQGYKKWWDALNTHAAHDDEKCDRCTWDNQ